MAKKRKDRRSKKDHRLRKLRLVKQGRCRQCGRKRTGKSKSRCRICLAALRVQQRARRHRPATATKKGRAKVLKRERRPHEVTPIGHIHTPRKPRPSELRAKEAREQARMAQAGRSGGEAA